MGIMQSIVKQFSKPDGWLGEIAGWIMATRESNLARNRWTVELLDLQPDDRVLEIGPGPGVTLKHILEKTPQGKVVAIDHSSTMLGQCLKRNADAVSAGRLELKKGDYHHLTSDIGTFDKILAVNSLQFGGIQDSVLIRLHSLLRDNGMIAVTFQPRGENPTNESGREFAMKVREKLDNLGFLFPRIEVLEMQPVNAFCVLAKR